MTIKPDRINSVQRFLTWHLQNDDNRRYLFRGSAKEYYPLLPKICRNTHYEKSAAEKGLIARRLNFLWDYLDIHLPAYGYEYDEQAEFHKKWKQIILAQHYGVPTQLLDFTRNPLVALYFAVENHTEENGALFAVRIIDRDPETARTTINDGLNIIAYDKLDQETPRTCKRTIFIEPPLLDKRLSAQIGVFCFIPEETIDAPLDCQPGFNHNHNGPGQIIKFIIPSSAKEPIRKELNKIGISRLSLFPDLQGFGSFMEWKLFGLQ